MWNSFCLSAILIDMKKKLTCEENKTRLDQFLTSNLPKFSRSKIQKIIELGLVLVNKKIIKSKHFSLTSGDVVVVDYTEDKSIKMPESIENTKIISETVDYLIIEKPAGVLTHQVEGMREYSLIDWVLKKYPKIKKVGDGNFTRSGIVHRLDKKVSGLMVIPKNQKMFNYLKQQFQSHTVIKKYYALVYGEVSDDYGEINFPISRSKSSGKMVSKPHNLEGKSALTLYEVIKRFGGYTLLDVEIKTGRNHQIRTHMQAIGHPVVGDELYKMKNIKDRFNLNRIFLHSHYLEFDNLQAERKIYESKLPGELEDILNSLKTNG
jgi:23S rRNA pseudouridine1911/1915/1917 synthase